MQNSTSQANDEWDLSKYGGVLVEAPQESSNQQQSTATSDEWDLSKYGAILADQPAQPDQGTKPNEPEKQEYSTLERLMQFGRGVTNTYTAVSDLFQHHAVPYMTEGMAKGADALGFEGAGKRLRQEGEEAKTINSLDATQKQWNELAGRDLKPTDKTGHVLELTGEMAAPFPIKGGKNLKTALETKQGTALAKTALDEGLKALSRATGAGYIGASAQEHEWLKDSPVLKFMEELTGMMIGSSLGEAAYGTSKSSLFKALGKTVAESVTQAEKMAMRQAEKEATKEFNPLHKAGGKILSVGSKVDEQLVKDARAEGIRLPYNVYLNNPFHNILVNNVFKSIFTSRVFRNVLKEADEGMVNGLKQTLEGVHPEHVLRGEASDTARTFLHAEKEAVQKQGKELYDYSDSLIEPTDKVSIKPFIEKADKILTTMSDSPSGARATVYNKILDIYDKWGLLSKEEKKVADELSSFVGVMDGREVKIPQEVLDKVSDIGRAKKQDMHILASKVENQRKDWNQLYNPLKNDFSRMFGVLTHGLKDSLKTSTNKKYIEALFSADKFHELNVANRVKSDIANSLMNGQIPKEAIHYMDTPLRVQELGKVLGDSPKAQEIFQSLKRAKLQEVLMDKAVDGSSIITEKGQIRYGALANSIKSHNAELMMELLGKEQFHRVRRLANIADSLSRSGREIGTNTSMTSIASSDLKRFESGLEAALGGLSAMTGIGSYAAGAHGLALTALGTTATWITAVNGLSRMLSSENLTQAAIHYGQAIKNKNPKEIESAFKRLQRNVFELVARKEPWVVYGNQEAE